MRYALVFPGQGTQHPEMLPWLSDGAIVRASCDRLGVSDWRAAVADPAWAERNLHAQVLLTGLALAAWREVSAGLPPPAAIAGYSVGELAAFSAAGSYDAEQAIDVAQRRAVAMDSCAAEPGGLLAVSDTSDDAIQRACVLTGLAVAIRNGVGKVVLGGPHAALDRAGSMLAALGARCTRLRVGVASHTPSMRPAAAEFLDQLSAFEFRPADPPPFCNATAERVADPEIVKARLAAQLCTTVRWDECMDGIRSRDIRCVIEVGAGRSLARLWNERYPEVQARSCDDFRSAKAVTRWIERTSES